MSWNPPFDYSLSTPNPGKFHAVAMFIQSGVSGQFVPANVTTFSNSSTSDSGIINSFLGQTGLPLPVSLSNSISISGVVAISGGSGQLLYVTSPIESNYTSNPLKTGIGLALSGNINRKLLSISNLSTVPLYVSYTGTPNSISFHEILPGGAITGNGFGGILKSSEIHAPIYLSGSSIYANVWEAF